MSNFTTTFGGLVRNVHLYRNSNKPRRIRWMREPSLADGKAGFESNRDTDGGLFRESMRFGREFE